ALVLRPPCPAFPSEFLRPGALPRRPTRRTRPLTDSPTPPFFVRLPSYNLMDRNRGGGLATAGDDPSHAAHTGVRGVNMSGLLRGEACASTAHSLSPGAAVGGEALAPADRGFLLGLQRHALQYFLDNQTPGGLILDRQRNHGPRRAHGLCSTAATGMGFVALALASAPPYRLLRPRTAVTRVAAGLRAALERLPDDHGAVPH